MAQAVVTGKLPHRLLVFLSGIRRKGKSLMCEYGMVVIWFGGGLPHVPEL
jgi:hypothetical protein